MLCLLIGSQPKEHRLTKLVVVCPLGKLDLGDQHRFKPVAAFHDCRCNSEAPSAFALLRQVYKRTIGLSQLLELGVEIRQEFVREAGADSAGKQEPVGAVVANERRTEIFASSLR